jgi:hypothetical protein
MLAPKPISRESVPAALTKAERYRLLNEPSEAESICLDILAVDPDNQQALISLILALTDQMPNSSRAHASAMSSVARLSSEYDRLYYEGIVWERRAKARFYGGGPGARDYVHDWLMKAVELYERAEQVRPAGNDDAVLRWNACARFLQEHRDVVRRDDAVTEHMLLE